MITEVFYFFLLIACIQSSPPDTQLFRPFLLNQNDKLPKSEPKIIGGLPATLLNTTYQASIRIKSNDVAFGFGHICGGSLIKLNVVLTAAHCLYYIDMFGKAATRSPSELKIVMGTLNLYSAGNSRQSSVTRYVIHERYNPNDYPHDLAVLFLSTPVPDGHAFIRPIPIASYTLPTNSSCQVSGFGSVRYSVNALPSPYLLVASLEILDYTRCKARYGNALDTGMLCAGNWNGTRDSCQGDSGGPLACYNNNVLSGVVSWGDRCGVAGSPGVYANVASYYDWIIKNRSSSLLVKDGFLFINLIAIIIYFNKF